MTAPVDDVTTSVTLNIQTKDLLYRTKQNFCFKNFLRVSKKNLQNTNFGYFKNLNHPLIL